MYFAKDEVIVLNNQKRYLILDSAILDDTVYYKIKEVSDDNKLVGNEKYITSYNKGGKIFINENLSTSEIDKIIDLFES